MSIIIPANSAAGGGGLGYQVANSCRFNSASSDSLFRTTESATNIDKYTFSIWVKRSILGASNCKIWGIRGSSANEQGNLEFNGDFLQWNATGGAGGNTTYRLKTNATFRDPAAWYNIVVAFDSTQGTADNRLKMYINGVEETSFSARTNPSSGFDPIIQQSGYILRLGQSVPDAGGQHFDGYFAETVFVDGQQLTATSFGEFNSDSGIWVPKEGLADDLTFGNNGFYLEYKDSSALGADTSGNSNNFSVKNLAAIDQTTDTCTNNFATLNPLYKQDGVFSEGNLAYTISASDFDSALSTIAPSLGKWYFETKITAQAGSNTTRSAFGICDVRDGNLISEDELGQNPSGRLGDTLGYAGNGSGNVLKNGSDQGSGFNTTYGTNDILSCAVDLDNGAVYYRKNGSSWFNSGNPESGSSRTGAVTITTGQEYVFGNTAYAGSAFIMNFGNPAFTGTDQADGNDRGSFEYAVPSGYLALCSLNLSEVLS